MQINKHKLARQEIGINKVVENFIAGLGAMLCWCTGMGKTFATFLIIEKMLVRDNTRTTIVVVPTENLKQQWERQIKKRKLNNIKVFVVNGITINQIDLSCTLLVLDEGHKYLGDIFKRVFEIKHKFLLVLTASEYRLDGKHELLL